MDALIRIAAAGIVGAILITVIKKQNQPMALALSLACSCLLCVTLLSLIQPLLSFVQQLRETAGFSNAFLMPLLKTVAIGLVTDIAATVCSDAGENSLSRLIGLCGAAAALCCAMPLSEAVLSLVETLLE